MMELMPVTLEEAKRFIMRHHRHNGPPQGWKWGVALYQDSVMVGCGVAGRPVARGLDDGFTIEITRVCTLGARNANSMIYGALIRAARALGYRRVVTYTLEDESGSSLRAVGFSEDGRVVGKEWDTPSRPRETSQMVGYAVVDKVRWVLDVG